MSLYYFLSANCLLPSFLLQRPFDSRGCVTSPFCFPPSWHLSFDSRDCLFFLPCGPFLWPFLRSLFWYFEPLLQTGEGGFAMSPSPNEGDLPYAPCWIPAALCSDVFAMSPSPTDGGLSCAPGWNPAELGGDFSAFARLDFCDGRQ